MKKNEKKVDGFVLLAVLWITAILSVIALTYASSARINATGILNIQKQQKKFFTIESAIILGYHEYQKYKANKILLTKKEDVEAITDQKVQLWYPRFEPYNATIGDHEFLIHVLSDSGKLNINKVKQDLIKKILKTCGAEETIVNEISDSLLDWRDQDDLHHSDGGEKDYYMEEPGQYLAKNYELENIEELLLLKGMDKTIYYGEDPLPGLKDFFSIRGSDAKLDVNTASPGVFQIVKNISPEDIEQIVQARMEKPIQKISDLSDKVSVEAFNEFKTYFGVLTPKKIMILAVPKNTGNASLVNPTAGEFKIFAS